MTTNISHPAITGKLADKRVTYSYNGVLKRGGHSITLYIGSSIIKGINPCLSRPLYCLVSNNQNTTGQQHLLIRFMSLEEGQEIGASLSAADFEEQYEDESRGVSYGQLRGQPTKSGIHYYTTRLAVSDTALPHSCHNTQILKYKVVLDGLTQTKHLAILIKE